MHSVGEPVVQRGVESWMPQFGYGVGLELSDSLTGDVKVLADLFEGAGLTAVEPEAQREDLAFAGRERCHEFGDLGG